MAPDERAEVDGLLAAAAAADHHRPLSEQMELALDRPSAEILRHRDPDGTLAGVGVLARSRGAWDLEVVVHPTRRTTTGGEPDVEARLLRAALDRAGRSGGGTFRYWAFRAPVDHDAVVRPFGLAAERELLQMRVPLPLDPALARAGRGRSGPLTVRPFRPGQDEARWLAVNNRAFADHPEQGGWDVDTLAEREAEPWFDPAGFLLHEDGGRLAGSCWTKVHLDTAPPMGEIYVISVDPDFAGRGLGRALTVAGLAHLAAPPPAGAGLTLGMLYVDAANDAAVGLYRSLGFTVDHVDRAYVVDLPPVGG